jgi:phospholipase C
MKRRALHLWLGAIAATIAVTACGGGTSSSLPMSFVRSPQTGSPSSPIKHVVVVIQENRSFDDFFALFPGADGATRGKRKVERGGKFVDVWTTLKPHALVMPSDIQHCRAAFLTDYDGGKMDGFGLVDLGVCREKGKPAGTVVYQYVEQSQIQPYWDMADLWVLADHLFQTQGSGSFTAHQDLIRGDTAISSSESLVDNPTAMPWGCDAGSSVVTSLLTSSGKYLLNKGPFPCTNKFPSSSYYQTLGDLLDTAGVSWKYYSPCFKAWNKNGCDDGCPTQCSGALLNAFDVIWSVRNGPEWGTNVSMPETNIFNDITGGALPAVSWVIPADANSDHPGEPCGCDDGPSWVASVVNAIGQSSYWDSTAIVVVWDDWGGFYDSVPPKQYKGNVGGLGFRVPAIVISPYDIAGSGSQGGYVSHTPYEFGSILKFIEKNWNLGSLNTSDKRANSIGDVLNYNQQPRAFTMIPSAHSAEYFEKQPRVAQHGDPE